MSDKIKTAFLALLFKRKFTLLEPYTKSTQYYRVKCQYHHPFTVRPTDIIYEQQYGCRICAIWERLQRRTDLSKLKHQGLLLNYAQKHSIPYEIPKPTVIVNRKYRCKVTKCEPTRQYLQQIIERHHLPWDINKLQRLVVTLEKYKFNHHITRTIIKHKETLTAVVLYWWGQTHRCKYAQATITDWVGITTVTLRTWLKLFRPFFTTLEREQL